tara:strand:- start:199 stop:1224 length:1026 start_codon:yes stop_codon:yes gene_type:complete
MSPKNLTVINKTHNFLLKKLKNKKIFNIYRKFESCLDINESFIVAVSGGPDSLALTFLSKIYSIKKSLNSKYLIVDHKLRKNSTLEANYVKKKLKKFSINPIILTWNGTKPKKNIQSISRDKRYSLLVKSAKKFKIKNILLGHHMDDLIENFFIRLIRGSGLNGLVSLDKKSKVDNINLYRPLINFNKEDLTYIAKHVFSSYVVDPSNQDDKFKRVKIRNLLKRLEKEGLDKNKFLLTINNLKSSNNTIKFYTIKNLEDNVTFVKKKESVILNRNFFYHSPEVVFRSLTEIIKIVGKKYYSTRGKKVDRILKLINTKPQLKITLGGCVIKKVNETVLVTKE